MRPALFLVVLSALIFSGPAHAQTATVLGTISIVGTGEVLATPDMAIIGSGVVTRGKSAREALDTNTIAMNRIFELLQNFGIEQKDMQTSGFSVQPQYSYSDERDTNGYTRPPLINGYQVFNNLSVKVHNLDMLGELLDSAVTIGANQINSISFAVNDNSALLDDARRAAMADARAKAELYADAAGVSLGNILSISEGRSSTSNPPLPGVVMMARVSSESADVPVAAGQLRFSKQVSVSWALVQD